MEIYDANFMVSLKHKNLWLKTFYLSLTRTTVSTIEVSLTTIFLVRTDFYSVMQAIRYEVRGRP